jgi:2-amino-4-hydroxy-6-hydroxymethyldihydropteridine diphosphokinase
MATRRIFIGLGSNIGDRRAHLDRARKGLGEAGLRIVEQSALYRTEPVEVVDQEEFINQVVGCETGLDPEAILGVCLSVERSMGRVRIRDKGPRVIDLDLLLAGDDIRSGGSLQVPHPRMHLRRFVLVPLAEISPGARHPVLNLTAADMLSRCPDRSRVERVLL